MLKTLTLSFLFLVVQEAFLAYAFTEPFWASLRVTWSPNIFSARAFAKLPRTESSARASSWTKLPGECSGEKFLGIRYMKGGDPAVVLLFDKNGFIAGIQQGIPKRDVENLKKSNFNYENSPAYNLNTVDDDAIYFVTAYFVNPSIICHEGRTNEQFETEGTGTGLYLQNGTNPIKDSLHVPLYEAGVNVTRLVKGACFPSMGLHYWYDISEHMDCRFFYPATVIYNRGKLTSFAFVSFGYYEFSTRFEYPPQSQLGIFLPTPIPQCINEEYGLSGGFSTMHVYFSLLLWDVLC